MKSKNAIAFFKKNPINEKSILNHKQHVKPYNVPIIPIERCKVIANSVNRLCDNTQSHYEEW